ncbi:Phosphatidylinositol-4-phosphate 5-kinase [Coemansia sp. RSA 986]|nr:Phosphatidylinositol-4-phosphate 5-kinase [Coemansia sp. RSA 986]
MAILTQQNAALARIDDKKSVQASLHQYQNQRQNRAKAAPAEKDSITTPKVGNSSETRGSSDTTATYSSADPDELPFIVSGPLLPIRQAKRGVNPNRNYRVIGMQSIQPARAQQQQQQQHLHHHHHYEGSPIAPPTPVSASASASASASSTSYSSRTHEPTPSLESGSNRSSSKSTIALISLPSGHSDGRISVDNIVVDHSLPVRIYDKHREQEVQELPMEPISINSQHIGSYRHYTHSRHSSSHGQLHGAESEGRSSGSVPVISLLPGARSSLLSAARRSPAQSAHSPPNSESAIGMDGGMEMTTQQYLVQRIPTWKSSEQETKRLSSYTSLSASQIRLTSPRARLYEQQHRHSPSQDLNTLERLSAYELARAAANVDTPAYSADSEMEGDSSASPDNLEAKETSINGARTDRSKAVATAVSKSTKGSWDVSSDEGADAADANGNEPKKNERQRRRQVVVNSSVTTEKYHVRPISMRPSNNRGGTQEQSGAEWIAAPMESPVDVAYLTTSMYSPSLSVKSMHRGLGELNNMYAVSSADEHPLHTEDMHPHFYSREEALGTIGGHGMHSPPGLDHRATSFDLGHIGRGYQKPGHRSLATPSPLRVRISNTDNISSEKVASLSQVRVQQPNDGTEDGYDGDSEAVLNARLRTPVQRRNTVAGEKIDEAPSLGRRSTRLRMPRNTSDFSDLMYGKDERRALRNSRRRSTAQSLLPIGTQISPGHANYVLMYNMLTGIRVSVSRCEAKDPRPVRPDDYIAAHKYSFDVVGDEMTPSSRYDFKFKDYAPWVFRCIREAFHLSTEDYLASLTDKYILSEVGSSGKSGSFFYYSQDYRFIIKTVHHTEHKFMREILPQYYEFVRDHPDTLLSRIYGLHRIKLPHGRKVHFIVMSNILPPNKDIHAQFDLKGSMLGRELSAEMAAKPRACMKDKNWVSTRQRLLLGPSKRRAFVQQLIEDVTLLIRLNIMDYSLLIGIHDLHKGNAAKLRDTTLAMFDPQTTAVQLQNRMTRAHTIRKKVVHTDPVALDSLPQGTMPPLPESMFQELRYSIFYREDGGILSSDRADNPGQLIYYLGVIDILTSYNLVKRTEHIVKSVVHDGSQISAINPRKYGLRFLRFIIRSLDGYEDVLPLLDQFERTTYQEICREHRFF